LQLAAWGICGNCNVQHNAKQCAVIVRRIADAGEDASESGNWIMGRLALDAHEHARAFALGTWLFI
jgi:hypothetical protein